MSTEPITEPIDVTEFNEPKPRGSSTSVWLIVVLMGSAFVAGAGVGFFAGVFSVEEARDFFAESMTDERQAEVVKTHRIERDAFELQYPGNWEIDCEEFDFDLDWYFSIDSSGHSYVAIWFWDEEADEETQVQAQIDEFSDLLSDVKTTRFKKWGQYAGEGAEIRGRMFGLSCKVRAFCHSDNDRAFTIVEFTYDEDEAMTRPGFDLIERTFHLKEMPAVDIPEEEAPDPQSDEQNTEDAKTSALSRLCGGAD